MRTIAPHAGKPAPKAFLHALMSGWISLPADLVGGSFLACHDGPQAIPLAATDKPKGITSHCRQSSCRVCSQDNRMGIGFPSFAADSQYGSD